MEQWVYDFSEGSKDMRELLGGKGANVAEMTRVLGEDRVPAGFTITTEACVAYMKAGQEEPEGMADQVEEALERLQERAGKRLGDDEDPLLVSVRVGRPRVDAGDARHRPQPRAQRHVGRGPRQRHRQRALRLGLLPALRADVRQRLARHRRRGVRGRDQGGQGVARRQGGHRPRRRRAQGAHGEVQGALRLPAGPAGAAPAGDPRGVRLVDRRARGGLPAAEPHPRRVGHGGQRPADGVRQHRRQLGDRRRVQPRRNHRRTRAVRRLPRQRAGRGRGLGAFATRATSPR